LAEHPFSPGAPLRSIILAQTGQDVRLCARCSACEADNLPHGDLSVGELMQAAARDSPQALTCKTLWAAEALLSQGIKCQAGVDVVAVIRLLQKLAKAGRVAPQGGSNPKEEDRR